MDSKKLIVLALDPGTTTGWALYYRGQIISGVVVLDSKRIEGPGMRIVRLETFLDRIEMEYGMPTLVMYEEVRRHLGTHAAHFYGAYTGLIQKWCEDRKIEYTSVPVQTIKAFALGPSREKKREKSKAEMVRAANSVFGKKIKDDNEADACFILACGMKRDLNIDILKKEERSYEEN